MVSKDPNFWAERVENEGMWSLTLNSNDRIGGNADFGFCSVFYGETYMFKDDEWDVLVQDPLTVPSKEKVGEEEHEAERSDAGLIDLIKRDTTETKTRDVKEDVLVRPRAKDIFPDAEDYQDAVFVNIPYTIPESFAETQSYDTRGNDTGHTRLDIVMPGNKGGENFGEYVRDEMESGNLNNFVSALAQERGDASEEVVEEVLAGNGEFGPRSVTYSEKIDAYREAENNSKYADSVRRLESDETYEDSKVEEPATVSKVQRLNW
jgi:hypothetical protein